MMKYYLLIIMLLIFGIAIAATPISSTDSQPKHTAKNTAVITTTPDTPKYDNQANY